LKFERVFDESQVMNIAFLTDDEKQIIIFVRWCDVSPDCNYMCKDVGLNVTLLTMKNTRGRRFSRDWVL